MIPEDINHNLEESILAKLGENFHYLKTILGNKVEITKLEFLDKISGFISLLIFSIIGIFSIMTIALIFIVTVVVYLASIFGSYLTALLVVNGALILIGILSYFFIKPMISVFLEGKMMNIINIKSIENDPGKNK